MCPDLDLDLLKMSPILCQWSYIFVILATFIVFQLVNSAPGSPASNPGPIPGNDREVGKLHECNFVCTNVM